MHLFWGGLIIILSILNLADLRLNDDTLHNRLQKDKTPVSIHYYKYEQYNIRYAEVGEDDKPLLIFVHGAPGSLDAFMGFLNDSTLRKYFHMISVDRPGYGYSGFGKPLTSIEQQAKAFLPLLKLNKNKAKPLLVGHSYGGSIVARMAMLEPDDIGEIQLVGAAVDPGHEKIFWISYLVSWKLFHWLVPISMDVANEEKLTHIHELKKMESGWKDITIPVTIIHGEQDDLVPVENAYFAEKNLRNARVTLKIYEKTGHLIPWMNPDYMKKEIMNFLTEHSNQLTSGEEEHKKFNNLK